MQLRALRLQKRWVLAQPEGVQLAVAAAGVMFLAGEAELVALESLQKAAVAVAGAEVADWGVLAQESPQAPGFLQHVAVVAVVAVVAAAAAVAAVAVAVAVAEGVPDQGNPHVAEWVERVAAHLHVSRHGVYVLTSWGSQFPSLRVKQIFCLQKHRFCVTTIFHAAGEKKTEWLQITVA